MGSVIALGRCKLKQVRARLGHGVEKLKYDVISSQRGSSDSVPRFRQTFWEREEANAIPGSVPRNSTGFFGIRLLN